MEEILRVIDAFQTSDKHKVATPANWKPGDKVIVPPPKTKADAEKRLQEGYDCTDWWFCKKDL
jgi:peroxiredoxin (alkyl hydroperoxide reductase subunit C)